MRRTQKRPDGLPFRLPERIVGVKVSSN